MIRVIADVRARRAPASEDSGFALIFVLFVTTLVMIGTAAMLSVTAGNIRPAKQAQDSYAALSAAQSGIQEYLANLNAQCRTLSVQSCDWLAANPTRTGSLDTQSWSVKVLNPENYVNANDGTVRLVSTGTAGGATKTLTADVTGKPSVLRFAYFTNTETPGKTALDAYYGPRTITLTNSTVADAVGLPVGSTVRWTGSTSSGFGDSICDDLYYNDPSNTATLGRASQKSLRTGLASGTDFREDGYTRTPVQQALGALGNLTGTSLSAARTLRTRDAACEVAFSKGMSFDGPVYSRDALRISNGDVGSTSGPTFTVPTGEPLPAVSTGWSASSTPAATPATPYRSDAAPVGGTPVKGNTADTRPLVQTYPVSLSLPTTATPRATCTYTGPTRVVLNGGTATISSPLTAPVTGNPCFTSTAAGAGVVSAAVPIGTTTIKINPSTSTTTAVPSFPGLKLGDNGDITRYSPTAGDAYVEGSLTAAGSRLSLVAANDIVVTDKLTTSFTSVTNPERTWKSGAAIDLVATNNVRLYHPVACASGTATDGWCPNDITGLYTNSGSGVVVNDNGTLKSTHPSKQYTTLGTPSSTMQIDAAVIALNGSFLTDNVTRGGALGSVTVNGGVYANHRGALGQLWETTTSTGTRESSGYKLTIKYLSYTNAGLPYVPVLDAGNDLSSPWYVLNVSTGGS